MIEVVSFHFPFSFPCNSRLRSCGLCSVPHQVFFFFANIVSFGLWRSPSPRPFKARSQCQLRFRLVFSLFMVYRHFSNDWTSHEHPIHTVQSKVVVPSPLDHSAFAKAYMKATRASEGQTSAPLLFRFLLSSTTKTVIPNARP